VVELSRRAIETGQLEARLVSKPEWEGPKMKSFKERLNAIEARLRKKPGAGTFRILEISGGLPGPVGFAYAGALRWERAEGEEFEAFVRRSALAAFNAGEMVLNVGGLPRGDEMAKFATFEEWWQTVAPFYPEVPNEEAPGFVRPASRW
jgi:hypothetical protein